METSQNIFQSGKCDENASELLPFVLYHEVDAKTHIPDGQVANLPKEDSTTDILQSNKELESAVLCHYTRDMAKELLTKDTQDQPTHFNEATFVEAIQSEYVWSSSPSPGSRH